MARPENGPVLKGTMPPPAGIEAEPAGEKLPRSLPRSRSPATFFNAFHENFLRAEAAAGAVVETAFSLAGFTVRLKFAGSELTPFFLPALAHLPRSDERARLTVCLWDSSSTGIGPPPRRVPLPDLLDRGEMRDLSDGRYRTTLNADMGLLACLDRQGDIAFVWVRDGREMPVHERGAPLRAIIHGWLWQHRLQIVHAAALGTPEGGVLLAGRGGSGKSTAALSCLGSPLRYAGDDYCLLDGGAPAVHGLYNSAKLSLQMLERFPRLRTLSRPDLMDGGKALLFLHENFPEQLIRTFPLRALILPRVAGGDRIRIERLSPAAALTAFAPSCLFQLPGTGGEEFDALAGLVRKIPAFRVDLGGDTELIPAAVMEVLDRSSGRPASTPGPRD